MLLSHGMLTYTTIVKRNAANDLYSLQNIFLICTGNERKTMRKERAYKRSLDGRAFMVGVKKNVFYRGRALCIVQIEWWTLGTQAQFGRMNETPGGTLQFFTQSLLPYIHASLFGNLLNQIPHLARIITLRPWENAFNHLTTFSESHNPTVKKYSGMLCLGPQYCSEIKLLPCN